METLNCPKVDKCPIFLENVLNNSVGKAYSNIYCTKGATNYTQCVRYKLTQRVNKPIPVDVLPNSLVPLDVLINRINSNN